MAVDLRYATGEKVYGQSPVKIPCLSPDHQDDTPSMAVYPDHAHCFGCGMHLTEAEFLELTNQNPAELPTITLTPYRQAPWVPDASLRPQLIAWNRTLVDPASPRHARLRWLREHYGLWDETIRQYLIGHTGTRFSLPIWQGNQLFGVRFRLDPLYHDAETLGRCKYIQPRGQPVTVFRPAPHYEITIITEGEFDALNLVQLGYDAVTTTGGSGSLARLITPTTLHSYRSNLVYVAVDQDEAGDQAYRRLCLSWDRSLPRLQWPAGKDITEALQHVHSYRRASIVDEWVRDAEQRRQCAD